MGTEPLPPGSVSALLSPLCQEGNPTSNPESVNALLTCWGLWITEHGEIIRQTNHRDVACSGSQELFCDEVLQFSFLWTHSPCLPLQFVIHNVSQHTFHYMPRLDNGLSVDIHLQTEQFKKQLLNMKNFFFLCNFIFRKETSSVYQFQKTCVFFLI